MAVKYGVRFSQVYLIIGLHFGLSRLSRSSDYGFDETLLVTIFKTMY